MNVIEAIHRRRSVTKLADAVPTKAQIETLLECARWAPNHYLNEPWRFFVLKGEALEALGDVFAELVMPEVKDVPERQREGRLKAERLKPLRAPVMIVAAVQPPNDEDVIMAENVAAVACGVQNMLLAAEELGLAVKWRTGDPAYHTAVKRHFGLSDDWLLLAFLYVGVPDAAATRPEGERGDVTDKTTWLGW